MFENAEAAITYLLNISEEEFFRNFTFKDDALEEYKKYLEDFKRCNSDKNVSTNEKGKSLENLVLFVAEKTNLFTVIPNVKNASNEIDLLLCPKIQSRELLRKYILDGLDDLILECKNYNKKIDVTWVGKVYSLLKYQKCNIGIIFSYHGFTGKDWQAATGLAKKLYLSDGAMIIDFKLEDFECLADNGNFISVLKNKISNLKHDTKIEYNHHPIEVILSANELEDFRKSIG